MLKRCVECDNVFVNTDDNYTDNCPNCGSTNQVVEELEQE